MGLEEMLVTIDTLIAPNLSVPRLLIRELIDQAMGEIEKMTNVNNEVLWENERLNKEVGRLVEENMKLVSEIEELNEEVSGWKYEARHFEKEGRENK